MTTGKTPAPSVGRVVHYLPFEFGPCRAADVTEIPSRATDDVRVGLMVKHPEHTQFIPLAGGGVPYDDREHPSPNTWHWPERA